MAAKIVLHRRHVEVEDGDIELCCYYRFTEPVNGVEDGEVGFVPTPGMTQAQVLDELKQMAVDHANLQTSEALPFTLSDVITWEIVE